MAKAILKTGRYRIAAHSTLLAGLVFGTVSPAAAAKTSLFGSAALNYISYDAEADGRRLLGGDSLTQEYSIAWKSTNYSYPDQPRYYSLMAGYKLISFDTSVSAPGVDKEFNGSNSKFIYNAVIGYSPSGGLPVRVKAFISDDNFTRFHTNIFNGLIINDGLTYDLEGRGYNTAKGFTLDYYPAQAMQNNLRELPRIHFDYLESASKSTDLNANVDLLIRETSASLSKGANWLNYRRVEKINNRVSWDKTDMQKFQIGHVDRIGRRQWTLLTNWISVSADGQLITNSSAGNKNQGELYDVNFQAIATRRSWQASSFMNYNRTMNADGLEEKIRLPLTVNGIWDRDTRWHVRTLVERGRQAESFSGPIEKSYYNSLIGGATLFLNSWFTLSPSLMLKTDKGYAGKEVYEAKAGIETASTARFSNRLFINSGYLFRIRDDGFGTDESKTWSNEFTFSGQYRPSRHYSVQIKQTVDIGHGSDYLDPRWQANNPAAFIGNRDYLRSLTNISFTHMGVSGLSARLSGSYDIIMNNGMPNKIQTLAFGTVSYQKEKLTFDSNVKYDRRDDGMTSASTDLHGFIRLYYRPNRYHEALLRYDQARSSSADGSERTSSELLQQQTYRYFSRTGVIREVASLTEELSYKNEYDIVSKYLSLTGRYSPNARLSLYATVKYSTDSDVVTMYYNAGVGANFKLFSTSLEYTLAQRDKDDRIEKKLSASVSRSF